MNELTEQECFRFLKTLIPGGLKDAALLTEVCPEGWKVSPIYLCVHPTLEQSYEEYVRMHENIGWLGKMGRRKSKSGDATEGDEQAQSPDPPVSFEDFVAEAKAREEESEKADEAVARRGGVPAQDPELEEFAQLFGECLWDIFSDNHDVIDRGGGVVHLGSFRGSAGVIAEFYHRIPAMPGDPDICPDADSAPADLSDWHGWDMDYCRFYMGSWMRSGRADLGPIYRLIFTRLKEQGADWRYSFPRIGIVDFRKSAGDAARNDAVTYDPSKALEADQEDAKHQAKITKLRRELDDAHERDKRRARQSDPPSTVRAYQSVYGHFPIGWPPEV